MKRYEADGVIRGIPFGYDETDYMDYNIKIYSIEPGKVFYVFEKDTKPKEEVIVPVPTPVPEKEKQKNKKIDWQEIGEGVLGAITVLGGMAMIGFGVYELITLGSSAGIENGVRMITQGA